MTDKTEAETQSQSGPDGFIIIHRPVDKDVTPYGIGPFPPLEGLEEKLIAAKRCDCECMALYIQFPKGIRMMLVAEEDDAQAMALVALMTAVGATFQTDDDEALVH